MSEPERWPSLPLNEWQDTYRTLHMWTQIVGKIRMTLSPPLNHWWHVTLYVNSRGLTTGPVPYPKGAFEIQFDFQKHALNIFTSEGLGASRPLKAEPVANFYAGVMEALASVGIVVTINLKPQEVADPVPFDRDYAHSSYDAEYANRFWRILVATLQSDGTIPLGEVHRQVQSGPIFLGQFRLGVHAVFGACGAAAQRRNQRARVFARSLQRRLLAWRRNRGWPGVLFLHGSNAGRLIRGASGATGSEMGSSNSRSLS